MKRHFLATMFCLALATPAFAQDHTATVERAKEKYAHLTGRAQACAITAQACSAARCA